MVAIEEPEQFSGTGNGREVSQGARSSSSQEFFLATSLGSPRSTFGTTARLLAVGLMQNAPGCLPTR